MNNKLKSIAHIMELIRTICPVVIIGLQIVILIKLIQEAFMLISKFSPISMKDHTRDIPVTQEQLDAWKSGVLIQNAMPNISADDREFLMTGITPEEWDCHFSDDG